MLDVSPPTTEVPEVRKRRSWTANLGQLAERAGVPILLLALVVFFSTYPETSPFFATSANGYNILANQTTTGLIALGMVIPLVSGYFDISVAATAGLSSVTMASIVATHGQPLWLGLIAALVAGVLVGAFNGFLVGILRLNPFVTTFGTYIVLSGLLQMYTQGLTISNGIPPALGEWTAGRWIGIARPFWLLIIAAILVWFLLVQTPFGRRLAAIGSNEVAARLAGIRVDRAIFCSFVLSGLFAGLAGALLTARNASADATTAMSYLFPALAAVFLGQTSITPGRYNVWGTIFGVFLVAVAVAGFTFMGADAWITQLFNGLALLFAVAFSTLTGRFRDRRARTALAQGHA
jgi:ribose transport system permease protein